MEVFFLFSAICIVVLAGEVSESLLYLALGGNVVEFQTFMATLCREIILDETLLETQTERPVFKEMFHERLRELDWCVELLAAHQQGL